MKKNLLLTIALVVAINTWAQYPTDRIEKMPVPQLDPSGYAGPGAVIGEKLSQAIIGQSNFDLQTYNSIEQRLYAYPDGTVGATWMMAFEPDWPDRGIGYNYFDGSSWGSYPTESIASVRTGWAGYAPLGAQGEVAVGHANIDNEWGLLFCKRDVKGTGDWEEFFLNGPEPGVGIVWPAITSGGENHEVLHILGLTTGNEYMGQGAALLYSRSSDGGETWDIQHHFFEEIGPDYFPSIGAENYAFAQPRDGIVAFSVGFDDGHGGIFKSTDNGDTWTYTEVYNSPFYPATGEYTDPFGAGDGSQALSIDSEGTVHLVYGRMRHVYDETGAAFYYPATDGVIYWNENMPPLDTAIISTYTLEYLAENGNLVGQVVGDGIAGLIDFPAYFMSLTSHPQILIDGMDRIFVIWSGVAPEFSNGLYNYRHIYGNSSSDGGLTWNGIEDLTDELVFLFSECAYPALAPNIVNGELHFTFQEDGEPGIFVWAASQTEITSNSIQYLSIDTEVLTGTGAAAAGVSGPVVGQNYPNPFLDATWIEVKLDRPMEVGFSVTDISGRTVHTEVIENNGSTTHRIRFDRQQLTGGVYYYTVSTGSGSFSGKMIIQ